jgi:molybdopterin synthase catalytic subunit
MSVRVGPAPLSVTRAYAELSKQDGGGVVIFLGRVRPDRIRGRKISALTYEAHGPVAMTALRHLEKIAHRRFGTKGIVLWHRTGRVRAREPSVIVGVVTAHRAEAFAAARFLIEQLKHTAPIWKSLG